MTSASFSGSHCLSKSGNRNLFTTSSRPRFTSLSGAPLTSNNLRRLTSPSIQRALNLSLSFYLFPSTHFFLNFSTLPSNRLSIRIHSHSYPTTCYLYAHNLSTGSIVATYSANPLTPFDFYYYLPHFPVAQLPTKWRSNTAKRPMQSSLRS